MRCNWTNFRLLLKKTATNEEEYEQGFGETWLWTAIDTPSCVIVNVNFKVGRHLLEDARKIIQGIKESLAGDLPLFVSDELSHTPQYLRKSFLILY
jgi:hypothetical protein